MVPPTHHLTSSVTVSLMMVTHYQTSLAVSLLITTLSDELHDCLLDYADALHQFRLRDDQGGSEPGQAYVGSTNTVNKGHFHQCGI